MRVLGIGIAITCSQLAPRQSTIFPHCRTNGLSMRGGREACIHRLLALDAYVNSGNQGTGPSGALAQVAGGAHPAAPLFPPAPAEAGAEAGAAAAAAAQVAAQAAAAAAAAPVAPPVSRWTTVDEEEEKAAVPSVPISKWIALETEAAALRAQAAAQAAAAERAAAAAVPLFDDEGEDNQEEERRKAEEARTRAGSEAAGPGSQADAGAPPPTPSTAAAAAAVAADDEKRRARLRQVRGRGGLGEGSRAWPREGGDGEWVVQGGVSCASHTHAFPMPTHRSSLSALGWRLSLRRAG